MVLVQIWNSSSYTIMIKMLQEQLPRLAFLLTTPTIVYLLLHTICPRSTLTLDYSYLLIYYSQDLHNQYSSHANARQQCNTTLQHHNELATCDIKATRITTKDLQYRPLAPVTRVAACLLQYPPRTLTRRIP